MGIISYNFVTFARPNVFTKVENYVLYDNSGKRLVEIGVVFSREKRNVVEWEVRG